MKTIIIVLLLFTMPSFAQQKAYNDELADMDSFTIKGRNEATAGQPQDIAAGDIAEDTTPASGEYLIGFDATDQLIKVNIANLSGGGGGGVSAVGTPVDGQVGVWTGSAAIEGTSALVFDGKLGVGTDSPQEEIHIYNPVTPDAGSAILFNNATTGATATDGLFAGYSNKGYLWNYESTDIDFATSNTARLRLTSAGDLNLISGDITLASSSTVDGRDISVDGTKLDSVVTGAHTTTLAASAITVDNSSFDVLTGSDAQTLWNESDTALLNARSTGIRFGAISSLNASLTGMDIIAGSGQILNNTDPENPVFEQISWTAKTNVTHATQPGLSYWYFDANDDTVKQTPTKPSEADRRTRAYFLITSFSGGQISGFSSNVVPVQQTAQSIKDLADALGAFKTGGFAISPSGPDLKLKIASGTLFEYGSNWANSAVNPHESTEIGFDSGLGDFLRYTTSTTLIATDVTDIDALNYAPSGVVTAIPGNLVQDRFGIHVVFVFPGGNVRLAYGNEFFTNLDDAIASLGSINPLDLAVSGFENGIALGAIVVEKDVTDLTQAVIDGDAVYIQTNAFGSFAGGIISSIAGSFLEVSSNLSDLQDLPTAKVNLNYLASEIPTVTTNFDNNLSASDTNLQLALDTLNDLSVSADSLTWSLGTQSEVASGGNAFEFDTENSFTSGNIISIKDNGVEHFSIDHDGSIGIDKTQAGFASIGSVNGGLIVSGIESVILGDSTGTRNSSTLNKSEMIFGSVDDSFIYPQEHNSGTGKSRLTIRGARPSTADTNGDGAAISIGGGEGRGTGSNGPIIFEQMRITPVLDADLSAGETAMYLDESANKIIFKSKYSDGSTVKIFEIEANP